jgi:myo-inositol catabolism protein IolC
MRREAPPEAISQRVARRLERLAQGGVAPSAFWWRLFRRASLQRVEASCDILHQVAARTRGEVCYPIICTGTCRWPRRTRYV